MKRKPVTVILPTLNEAGNIRALVQEIDERVHPQEILVVDDQSTDGTAAIVRRLEKESRFVRCISNSPAQGLAGSIQRGIDAAAQPYICWMDADGSHTPETINRLFSVQNACDIAVASPYVSGGMDARSDTSAVFFSLIINRLCQLVFNTGITDYTSGFILAPAHVLRKLPLRGDYGEYCIDLLVRAVRQGLHVTEVGYITHSRRNGFSKTARDFSGFFRRGPKYLWTILRLCGSI